jgi:hypothetical protein
VEDSEIVRRQLYGHYTDIPALSWT